MLAAMIVSISTPSLAQHPHAATIRLEGPAPATQGSGGDSVFVSAVRQQAAACGMSADALLVTQERTSIEPPGEAEEAELDARVEAISAEAGFTGPTGDRQVSRAAIRAMLIQRLRLTLAYAGENAESGMACLVGALAEAGFSRVAEPAPFTQSQADAISDECGANRAWLKVEADGTVRFEPAPDGDYDAAACILQRIKLSGATKFGFVGNERLPPAEGHADE